MSRFDGKVALITGASAGIGAATAVHLASLGCSLAINGRNVKKLNEVSKKCQEAGLSSEKIKIVAGDISNDEDAKTVMEGTLKHFDRLDILINNAGIGGNAHNETFELTNFPGMDDIFRTNFRAAFHMMQLATPKLKLTKGNIVNVSSCYSQLATHRSVCYGSFKAALDHLTKSVARDLGPFGVRVNAVNPGFTDTEIFNKIGLSDEEVKELLKTAPTLSVLQRIASPMEVAKPIAFLASDDASFITGVTLLIDGGLVLKGGIQ